MWVCLLSGGLLIKMTSARAAQRVCVYVHVRVGFFFFLSFLLFLSLCDSFIATNNFFFEMKNPIFLLLPYLLLLSHSVATVWGCLTCLCGLLMRLCVHGSHLCVCVCGCNGDNPSWSNSFVSQRPWMWLCASLCWAKQVESTVCVCADVSHLLCV